MVDNRVFLITGITSLNRRHRQYQAFPLQVEGKWDRRKREETYFVEITDTKLAKQPASSVGFTPALPTCLLYALSVWQICYALRAVPEYCWRC
ncbi:hypothetical protein PISMIDRAFT_673846 [Pisolithus microcarpus 441]|uniref:Unplaced genomic scaffold scaffold_9, whole genome shotgun sequence n=1 Tax=Pisolithus microcarpus 441 TaxID=765257 RepID=A0A0C9ZPZ1_9AGAM|nr:hypothetical protein PISMIDRAFT_673846 [Pisolithus microcarpus 441]